MSNIDKRALREAAEKATPGVWVYLPKNTSIEYDYGSDDSQGSITYMDSGDFTQKQTDLNGAFIAAANPATVLALLDELEAKDKRIAELEASHGNLREAVAGIHNTITGRGDHTPLAAILNASKRAYEAALAARKPEWDGEGLPPVGVECEMSCAGDEWHKCVIIAKGEEQIIYQTQGCREFSGHRNNYRFRPIRSEADKKRDEIIEALKEGLGHAHGLFDLTKIYNLIKNGKIPNIRID